jgi:hypothetical protein
MYGGGEKRGGSQKVHKVIPGDLIMTAPLIYTVKKVLDFPVPCRDVTYHTLPGREYNLIIPAQGEFGK